MAGEGGEAQGFAPEGLAALDHLSPGGVDGEVDRRQRAVVRSIVTMLRRRSRSTRSVLASTSEACERPASSLCTLITAASAPAARASLGSVGEAQVGAPGLVDDERQAGRVRRHREARDVGAEAVVARRGHKTARARG